MNTIPFILLCGALATAVSSADTGIFGSYIEIQANATTTVYKGGNFGSVANIEGADLGMFAPDGTLSLTRSQINTYKNGTGDATFPNLTGENVTGSGDQAWGNNTAIKLLPATPGVYTPGDLLPGIHQRGRPFFEQRRQQFQGRLHRRSAHDRHQHRRLRFPAPGHRRCRVR